MDRQGRGEAKMSEQQRRVAVVTGAAQLHGDGWRVFLVDSDEDAARQQASRLGAFAHALPADVAEEAAMQSAIDQVRARRERPARRPGLQRRHHDP
jgi:NAD(P)-dependent dehydrogenase (short-subunit alcohol dehydrogenase family)